MFTKEARLKEIRYNIKNIRKYNHKLKERIIRLIDENKGKFFDPILRQEIIPMRRNMLKEEKELRAAVDMSFEEFAGIDKLITDFKRVLINNTKKNMWKELEPFIGLDPRHDGDPSDWDKKYSQCTAVRKIKEKYRRYK